MLIIRTAEELAHALATPLDEVVKERLAAHRDYLLDYPDFTFEELGLFAVVEQGDQLADLNTAGSVRLVDKGAFCFEPETVMRYGDWLEVIFVLSDDGFGLVLFMPLAVGLDESWLTACQELAPTLDLTPSR